MIKGNYKKNLKAKYLLFTHSSFSSFSHEIVARGRKQSEGNKLRKMCNGKQKWQKFQFTSTQKYLSMASEWIEKVTKVKGT